MPGPLHPQKITDFDRAVLREGLPVAVAARKVGVSESWAYARMKVHADEGLVEPQRRKLKAATTGPVAYRNLDPMAKKAWDDFGFFRKRYMGRVSLPWQVAAGEKACAAIESDHREYVVENCPPGAGKTVLMSDIAAWITVRNRRLRGLIGSGTQSRAEMLLRMLRVHLERAVPMKADPLAIQHGEAFDADSTLAVDFGMFRPMDKLSGDPWRADALLVVQPGFELTGEKEFTWMAYGLDTNYLGDRVDVMLWDDAVLPKDYQTVERMEMRHSNFDTVTESRLEPRGALFLIGQRVHGTDLYRHCLDKIDLPDDDETLDALEDMNETEREAASEHMGRMYQHIVYRAHYDEKCEGQHKRSDPPYPEGCLLSPRRLPWTDLRRMRLNDPDHFAVWYQQEDGDPSSALVPKVWVDGGTDPDTGVTHWGCWDKSRDLCELPANLTGPFFSYVSVDPSPTKYWGIQWWVAAPNANNGLYLMDIPAQRKFTADQLLDWQANTGEFVGLMQDWQNRSVALGLPITHWVVEHNGAQRFLLQYDHVRRWVRQHGCSIIPHTTAANKNDPKYGVWTIREAWRAGRVNLPKKTDAARLASMKLVDEVVRYPNGAADDQVMSMWMGYTKLPQIAVLPDAPNSRAQRPSWATGLDMRRQLTAVASA